ncbi:hypothetical protein OG436_16400 [Streptomyces caniferus]|uniref:Uncharacterized protein n=1 Tax=Streptomyces caniferus TaxID=285557 RepID=A0A640SI47_9ACTN|nr:hypothetical protein [Streptomyces caniferus]GFE10504.1 hypothetical protein Scani_67720 [Streptomyces caniferus]
MAASSLSTSAGIIKTDLVYDPARWQTTSSGQQDLPGATINLLVGGSASPSWGAIFVATFSAETLVQATGNNGVLGLDILFNGQQSHPVSGNHRFDNANDQGEWSSRTTTRVFEVPAQMTQSTFTAKVVVDPSATITTAGLQNWVLRIDRYSV